MNWKMLILAGGFIVFNFMRPATAQDEVQVLLDWFVNPDHGPLLIAREQGYFTEAGLAVDLIPPADPNDPPKLIAAGKGDIAITYQPNLYLQIENGLPLKRIGTLVSTPLNSLVTLKDGKIQSIADLKGANIGYSVGGFEDILLSKMLEKHGLTLSDIRLINVNFSLSPSLLSGQVDAVIGAFRNFELNQLALEGHEGQAFFPEEEGVPLYDELIYVVKADRYPAGDTVLPRFLKAIQRATIFILNHPDESWDIVRKAYPDMDNELNRLAWQDTLRRFAHHPGLLDTARYTDFAAFLKAQGMITKEPALETYAIDPLLKKEPGQ